MNLKGGMGKTATLTSQFLNVVLFGGLPDETVSARSHRQGRVGVDPKWSRRADRIDWLFRDPDHCERSHAKDLAFARSILKQ